MKAAPIINKPSFKLMKLTDIVSFYHIQVPRWFFADPKYRAFSSDTKLAYSLLLNRHQLSRLNNWINEDGEVFIIFTREDLAEELGISYRKAIQCMHELSEANLIWERRCGRGDANQIYLAKVELTNEAAFVYQSAPFVGHEQAEGISSPEEQQPPRPADSALLDTSENKGLHGDVDLRAQTRPADFAVQEMQSEQFKTCENGSSRPAEIAALDMQNPQASNNDLKVIKKSDIDSQSVRLAPASALFERRADDDYEEIKELDAILERCNLWIFEPETAKVFENAIERLFFTEKFRIGGAVLPQSKVRSRLWELDDMKLRDAEHKIASNTEQDIRNTTAYTMAVIFNSICEMESDLMNDPYLNSLKSGPPKRKDSGRWD